MAILVIAFFSHRQRFSVEVDEMCIVLLMQKGRGLCRNTVVMRNYVSNGSKQQKYHRLMLLLMQWLPGRMRS